MLKKIETDKTKTLSHPQAFIDLCQRVADQVQQVDSEDVLVNTQAGHIILIDVRDGDELVEQGYISGAYHLSKGWIEAQIHLISENKNDAIVLYCGSGKRSLLAANGLQQMGYANVQSMSGGFKGWKEKGLPVDIM